MVSAWASRQRLVPGQEATAQKSNEITATPLLLQRLELTGALVTIDAIGAQPEIARTILERGGDDLFVLRANRPELPGGARTCFADPASADQSPAFAATEADHGRIEHRLCLASCNLDRLHCDRRFAGERYFPKLTTIACIRSRTEREGKIHNETRYFVSSARAGAKALALAVRSHWGVENRLHWVLDVVFHDDLSRLRTGAGPHNMAIIRHMAVSLLRHPKDKHSLKNRRKLACLNQNYLENSSVKKPR